MAIVETEQHGQIFVIRMNRPERLNAMGKELREQLAQQWTMFRKTQTLRSLFSQERVEVSAQAKI